VGISTTDLPLPVASPLHADKPAIRINRKKQTDTGNSKKRMGVIA